MGKKIIGVTVGTTSPRPDWRQANTKKSDFIKNKPEQDLPNVTEADNDKVLQVEGGKWQAKTLDVDAFVSQHNTSEEAHSDIRVLLQELSNKVTDLLDSDDETLNEMHEVVAYITANRGLLDSVTISKVNVADIIDNLTTSLSDKPLSAKQGVALNALIAALDTRLKAVEAIPWAEEVSV